MKKLFLTLFQNPFLAEIFESVSTAAGFTLSKAIPLIEMDRKT